MSRRRSSSPMTCQNPACDFFPDRTGKDLVKNEQKHCWEPAVFLQALPDLFHRNKKYSLLSFSPRTASQVELICRLSQEKISMRGVSPGDRSPSGHDRPYYQLAGEHANLLTATSSRTSAPIGSNWMSSGRSSEKKNKHCEDPNDQNCGDWWTYTAIRGDTGLMIAHHAGK